MQLAGTPSAMASITLVPRPSARDGCQRTSRPATAGTMSSTKPAENAVAPPISIGPAPLASKKDQACTRSRFSLQLLGNCREISDAFFRCHRADHAADDAVIWPAQLFPPVSWDKRAGGSSTPEWTTLSAADLLHPRPSRSLTAVENGNETRYAISVLEPSGFRNE